MLGTKKGKASVFPHTEASVEVVAVDEGRVTCQDNPCEITYH